MAGRFDKEVANLMLVLKVLGWLIVAFLLYYYLLPAALVIFNLLLPLITPFLLGLLLAALLDPVVNYVTGKLKLARGVSVFGILLLVVGGVLALLIWMIARGIIELVKLSASFPSYAEKAAIGLEYALSQARILYFSLDLPAGWQNILVERFESASVIAINALEWSLGMLTAIPNGVLILFFAFISSYFFSKDKDKINQAILKLLPPRPAAFLHEMRGETGNAVIGYLRAQLVLMLITMGQTIIGLYILKVDYALLITIVVGFLDLLPVLGPGIIFVPWLVVSFFMGKGKLALALLILYSIISIVRQVLQPKILGDSIGVHPLETLISLYVGLKILGIPGIILGPILLVIFKGGWRYFHGNKGGY